MSTIGENWPSYKLNTSVRALKIKLIRLDGPVKMIVPEDPGFSWIPMDDEYHQKFNPQPGGYYVQAASGHLTYISAEAFESNFERCIDIVLENPIKHDDDVQDNA